jgi:hypothetical protein
MKLELTLPALERLIGGDSAIELALRQQIVDEFCRKHLKALLNDETFIRHSSEWRNLLRSELDTRLFELRGEALAQLDGQAEEGVRWHLREAITKATQQAVDTVVTEEIARQKRYIERDARESFARFRAAEIEKLVRESVGFDAEIQAEIERRVREGIERRLAAARVLEDPQP